MASRQRARNEAWKRTLPAHDDFTPESKHFTATHPALYVHVYCTFGGVRVHASVDQLTDKGRLVRTEIAKARWKPAEVSERLVVEWAQKALTRWLEGSPVIQDGCS